MTGKQRSVAMGNTEKKKIVKKKAAKKKAVKKKVTKKKTVKASSRVKGTIKRALKKKNAKKKVDFSFYAPLSLRVEVAGSFSNWEPVLLVKDDNGHWRGSVEIAPGMYEYRFLVDGRWENAQGDLPTVDNGMGSRNNLLEVIL